MQRYIRRQFAAIDASILRAIHAAELAVACNAARRAEISARAATKPRQYSVRELCDIRTFDRKRLDRRDELIELFRGSSVRPAHLFA